MEAFNSKRPSRSRYPPCENLINIGFVDPIHFSRTASPATTNNRDRDVVFRSPPPTSFDFSRNYPPQVFVRSASPLAAIENIQTAPLRSPLSSPLKVEEDVIVMDGILVKSPASGGGSRGPRSESGIASRGSRLVVDSGSSIETSSGRTAVKTPFVHGKEDLRPTQYSNKNKQEGQISKTTLSTEVSDTNATKSGFLRHAGAVNETGTVQKVDQHNDINTWSPLDDGIVACKPSSSTDEYPDREAVNAKINEVLYGSRRRRRLPVFQDICPE